MVYHHGMTRYGLALLVGLVSSACYSTPEDDPFSFGTTEATCPIGSETCACTDAGTCDPGLQCLSDLCVAEEGMGTTTDGSGSSGLADDTAGETDPGTTDGDTTSGDPCLDQCGEQEICIEGECVLECGPGELDCNGTCIDPLADMEHCGATADCQGANAGIACDPTPANACPGSVGETCMAGSCAACPSSLESFAFSGSIEELALPACVTQIHVVASGAQGGSSTNGSAGGLGAEVEGDLCVSPGTTLSILVGEQAESAPYPCGGGGGSFIVDGMDPLFIAGGGGGGYNTWDPGGDADQLSMGGAGLGGTSHNDGGGGGGFSGDGVGTLGSGGSSFLNGGAGGVEYPLGNTNIGNGAFGGGGGSSESGTYNAGGGGGYDGGNAGNGNASTGGTSFIAPAATNAVFTPATSMGNGSIEISW